MLGNNSNGECHRLAVACITGWHPFFIPWVCPHRKDWKYQDWEDAWVAVLEKMGWDATITWGDADVRNLLDSGMLDGRLWLAVVRGLSGNRNTTTGHHAIVMEGRKFYYDCNFAADNARRRAPNRFSGAWVLTPR